MPRQTPEVASFTLRMRKNLHHRLEREAQRHHFTLNNEIRIRLEDSLMRDTTRNIIDATDDMNIAWARLNNRYKILDLGDELAAAVLAQSKWEEIAKIARLWQHHRALDRRLNQGGVS